LPLVLFSPLALATVKAREEPYVALATEDLLPIKQRWRMVFKRRS
jgi:hypothetical protein